MPTPATPKLPKKSPRNTPRPFTESITLRQPQPQQLALPLQYPTLADRQLKTVVVIAWILASIATGIGFGLWLSSNQVIRITPGFPVAQTSLSVTPVATQPLIFQPEGSISVGQINPSPTVTLYQPTAGVGVLQPGYAAMGRLQGTVGTTPVQ